MPTSEEYAGSGIDGLDQVLHGGFARGLVYLVQGSSGAGKTTLGLQFLMEGAKHGERVLYLGTSESEEDLRRIAASHRWSLDGVTIYHQPVPEIGDEQTILTPAEVELPRTIESMLAVVEEVSPTRVVLDSLAEIRTMAQSELSYRRQLMALKNYFADRRCSVLVIEIPVIHEMLNSVVNGVLELQQMAPLYGPDRRKIRVAKIRGHDFNTGYHDYKIRTGGIDVFPRLTAAEHRRRFKRELVATGMDELDMMLNGGLIRGTSTLLMGASGTAKSLMATQLVVAAAERGERSVMYVFDERIQTLLQRAEGVGLPLEHHIEQGLIYLRQVDPAELTPGEFSDILKTWVENEDVRLVVIDSLNGYSYAMPDERFLSVHLHELSSYLNQQGVTLVYVMTQHGLLSPERDAPFDVSYVSDTLLLFRYFELGGEIHKALAVYKSRASAHEPSIRELKITSKGLQLGPPLREFRGVLTGAPMYLGERLHGNARDAESTRD